MNSQAQTAIAHAVRRAVAAGEMFTALDISRKVQAQGITERHNTLKYLVHDLFFTGQMGSDYTRTLCDVGGDYGPAWVYHRIGDDPLPAPAFSTEITGVVLS